MQHMLRNLFLQSHAVFIVWTISVRNNNITIMEPAKPNSSPTMQKIKSVHCSGINFSCVCVPCRNPLPHKPPEPIATLDWITFQPEPSASDSGLNNDII